MKKKFLVFFTVFALILSLTIPAYAALPNVNLGEEIEIRGDSSVKKVGVTVSQAQFDAISASWNADYRILSSVARSSVVEVWEGLENQSLGEYEGLINHNVQTENRQPLTYDNLRGVVQYQKDFLNWAAPRAAGVNASEIMLHTFSTYSITTFFAKTPMTLADGTIFYPRENIRLYDLQGGTLSMLVEIPAHMRGNYDYYVFGQTTPSRVSDMRFLTINNGHPVQVLNNNYVTFSASEFATFRLVAFPKATHPSYTTADALTVLRASVGLAALTQAQQERFAISGNAATSDALRLLRISVGLPTAPPPLSSPVESLKIPHTPRTAAELEALSAELFTLINNERVSNGLPALLGDDEFLNSAAKTTAEALLTNFQRGNHSVRNRNAPYTVAGGTPSFVSEGLSLGTLQETMHLWLNSGEHRRRIMAETFTHLSVGVVENEEGILYWVALFLIRE
jgi:uncharacterized protein YkwD